jgi:sRNA-binding regulator protein Hfq
MTTKYSEEGFIKSLVDSKETVDIYLTNGIRIKASILGSDIDVIFVGRNPSDQEQKENYTSMIYKTAISTIKQIK